VIPADVIARTGLGDTTPEAQAVLDEAYRRMPIGQKWRLLLQAQRRGRLLVEAGRKLRDQEGTTVSHAGEDVQVLRHVVGVLDALGIPYALGGSMASSIYGVMRTTQDADLTVEPFPGREQALAESFDEKYYVSVPAIREAVRNRTSFNIIDTSIGFKVDLFVRKDRPFEVSAMSRRVAITLPDRPEQPLYVLSPEDVILFKLEWYRLGGEVSERQWLDVQNVLKAQAERLDRDHLSHWAAELRLDDLLAHACKDAGITI
jgi:hypothetical protein